MSPRLPVVDLKATTPPPDWGVTVDHDALEALADRWADEELPLPCFDYPGIPAVRDERWWFDYVTVAVSVLACLWPPEGDEVWHAEIDRQWLDDAPGIFAVFTRRLGTDGLSLPDLAALSDDDGQRLFGGRGTLQLVPERVDRLRLVAGALLDRWDGSAANLVAAAERHGHRMVELLTTTVPGYLDRARTPVGELRFDKLAHLAAAIMAAGRGWSDAGFVGFDDFPVYPDYMLPRVFRHVGALRYAPDLAATVDGRRLVAAGSPAEHAIRWATVHCGAHLARALTDRGNPVPAPALDYRLWSEAVLGPDADRFGQHHRTITLLY
ncbi:MAG: queuosine salvage family protein [Acidimicrobiales bacterium]